MASAKGLYVWVVQCDERDKEEGNETSTRKLFCEKDDAMRYAIHYMKKINKRSPEDNNEENNGDIGDEYDRDETSEIFHFNETILYTSSNPYFYFKACDNEDIVYNPFIYEVIIEKCHIH